MPADAVETREMRLPTPPSPSPAVLEILSDNHRRWHIFFHPKGFHNHTVHTILALHSLGATEKTLRTSYQHTSSYQRASLASPDEITKDNWKSFLGDERYYSGYLAFFESEFEKRGVQDFLEHYLFSEKSNVEDGVSNKGPKMFSRLLDSIQHPLIHVGHGLEFLKQPSSDCSAVPPVARMVLIEGVAQTAIHQPTSSELLPPKVFKHRPTGDPAGIDLGEPVHALSILARLLSDPSLGGYVPKEEGGDGYLEVVNEFADLVYRSVDAWIGNGEATLDASDPDASKAFIQKKVEELIWTVALIYGVCGYSLGKGKAAKFGFIAHFVFAHFITGSYFVPAYAENLTPRSALLFLRGYFSAILTFWLGCQRPDISKGTLKDFFQDESLLTQLEAGDKTESEGSNLNAELTWDRIMEVSIPHLDEHVPKLQRSLKYFASQLGDVGVGYFNGSGDSKRQVELEGAEYIDGSLFLRTAVLSARRIGTMDNLADHFNDQRHGGTFVWDL